MPRDGTYPIIPVIFPLLREQEGLRFEPDEG
jgi:hypothetical protein